MEYTKINNSIVYLPKNDIDNETYDLIKKMSNSDVLNNVRVMPDCHSSSYCCVGMTSIIEDKVIPQIVGGDIGCGIIVYNLNKNIKEKHYKKIDDFIKKNIPMGENSHKVPVIEMSYMNKIYNDCNQKLEHLKKKFPDYNYQDFQFNENYYKKLVSKLNVKSGSTNFLKSLGTLGGGNHYIEFNKEENCNCFLSIHSGSRYLGQAICNFHQDKIRFKKDYNKKDFLNNYLKENDTVEYLIDMIFAQEFASHNRYVMMYIILQELNIEFNKKYLIETIHNYIDFERLILRKGAISAEKDKLCIISLNMRDGILICKGKGNQEWNYSSAHGCGRIMSRRKAVQCFNMKDYKKCMEDVYSSCINKDTLDEIPLAYKDVDYIKESIGDSVTIIKQLFPIINIKG
jgi:tRNA-splicing ligase RtcB (3'-phosphate/5'-hydroxy nucleic acid ligase)